MIKKMVVIVIVSSISFFLSGMELLDQKNNSDESISSKNKKGSDTKINITDVPRLKIPQGASSDGLALNKNGKVSIRSLGHISHLKNTQTTYRTETSRKSEQNNDDNIVVEGDLNASQEVLEINANNNDKLQTTVRKRNIALSNSSAQTKVIDEKTMWALLQKANPTFCQYAKENFLSLNDILNCKYDFNIGIMPKVYEFAKKYNMSLPEIMEMSHLMGKVDIEPEALAEFSIKHYQGNAADIKPLIEYFTEVRKKNPDNYVDLMLDFIRRTCFGNEGQGPSPLHTEHVAAQNQQIKSQKAKIFYAVCALIGTLITTFGGGAWGIFGQVNSNCHCPTTPPINSSMWG